MTRRRLPRTAEEQIERAVEIFWEHYWENMPRNSGEEEHREAVRCGIEAVLIDTPEIER